MVFWDQAVFIRAAGMRACRARLHLLRQPAYSLELNPVELLWDQTQDVTGNRHFADLDHLEEALRQALQLSWKTPTGSCRSSTTGSTNRQTLLPGSFSQFSMRNGKSSFWP